MSTTPSIGNHIRMLRKQRNLTLGTLAEQAELSKGYLSRVENGQHQPSFGVLVRLAKALMVPPGTLFEETPSVLPFTITRAADRKRMVFSNEEREFVQWSLSGEMLNRQIEPQILEVPFIDSTSYKRSHESFFFVLKGSIKLLDGTILNEGDSMHLAANVEHGATSLGDTKALVLLIICTQN